MVVGVLEVELVRLVVAVLRRQFSLHFVEFERLELQPDHRTGCVLCEDLIDLDSDLLSGFEFPFDEVVIENFFRERLSHNVPISTVYDYKSRVFRRMFIICIFCLRTLERVNRPGQRSTRTARPFHDTRTEPRMFESGRFVADAHGDRVTRRCNRTASTLRSVHSTNRSSRGASNAATKRRRATGS